MSSSSASQSPRLLKAVMGPSRAVSEAARGNCFYFLLKNLVSPGQNRIGKSHGYRIKKREYGKGREYRKEREY